MYFCKGETDVRIIHDVLIAEAFSEVLLSFLRVLIQPCSCFFFDSKVDNVLDFRLQSFRFLLLVIIFPCFRILRLLLFMSREAVCFENMRIYGWLPCICVCCVLKEAKVKDYSLICINSYYQIDELESVIYAKVLYVED